MELNPRYRSYEELENVLIVNNGKIDLGCGYYKPEGFVGIDNLDGANAQIKNETNAPDILMDLNSEKLPFADNSCSEVRSSHFLEHSVVDHIIAEAYRVLKPGGIFMFTVPYANSAEGMYPGHLIFFTEKWFYKNLHFNKLFAIENESFKMSEDWLQLPWLLRKIIPFKYARKHFFNSCCEMTFVCKSKKSDLHS